MRKDFNKTGRLAAFFILGAIAANSGACAQSSGKRVFATEASCGLAGWLNHGECKNAYINALIELDEKAPRFSSRTECEQSFKHCMIAGFNRKKVEFEPSMLGFEVTARAAGEKSTIPLVDGAGAALGLQPRPISHLSGGVSLSRQAAAQARWAQFKKSLPAAGPDSGHTPDPLPAMDEPDNKWNIPHTTSRPEDPATTERRRQEIQNAPTVY